MIKSRVSKTMLKIKLIFFSSLILVLGSFAETKEEVKESKEKKEVKKALNTKTFLTHKKTEFKLVKDGDGFRLEKVVPVEELNKEKAPKEEPKDEQKQLEKPIKIKIYFQAEPRQAK